MKATHLASTTMREHQWFRAEAFVKGVCGVILLFLSGSLTIFAQSPITVSPAPDSPPRASDSTLLATPASKGKEVGPAHIIVMSNKEPYYSPPLLTVGVGETIRWVNSERSDTHSIHERAGKLISPDLQAGKEWCFQFSRPGEYVYTCRFHPWMQGRIIVEPRNMESSELAITGDVASARLAFNPADGRVWSITRGATPLLSQLGENGFHARLRLPPQARGGSSFGFDGEGNLWFVSEQLSELFEFNSATRSLKAHTTEQPSLQPTAIAIEGQKRVWLFDARSGSFAYLDRATGRIVRRHTAKVDSQPLVMACAPDGKLWFVKETRRSVGVYDPGSDQMKEFLLPEQAKLVSLVVAQNSQVWLADAGRNKLIKIEDGWITEYTVPTSYSSPQGLAFDGQGNIWFAETGTDMIGRFYDGRFEEYKLSTPDSRPLDLSFDSDGNLWFTQQAKGKFGHAPASMIRLLGATNLEQANRACAPALEPGLRRAVGGHH